MRTIKFRAWYKHEEKMRQVLSINLTTEPMRLHLEGLSIIHYCGVGDNVELMQFTGIQDKNGKDIYEGDIVRYDAIDSQGFVTWVDTGPGFYILNPAKTGAFVLHDEWEVIGNVWEHPELIKGVEKE